MNDHYRWLGYDSIPFSQKYGLHQLNWINHNVRVFSVTIITNTGNTQINWVTVVSCIQKQLHTLHHALNTCSVTINALLFFVFYIMPVQADHRMSLNSVTQCSNNYCLATCTVKCSIQSMHTVSRHLVRAKLQQSSIKHLILLLLEAF